MKNKIFNILKSPIIYVLMICVIIQIKLYNYVPEFSIQADSYSYYEQYGGGNIFKGEVDDFRTPGYPYFIKFIKLFSSEENLYNNVANVQKILFFLTLVLSYLTIRKFIKNRLIQCLTILIIGICPYLVLFNTLILTETLGIFEMSVLMYITACYLQKPRKSTAIISSLFIFFMIMTRPGFIYLIPIYLVFWILRYLFNKKEKESLYGIIATIVCLGLVIGYCGVVKKRTKNFMISAVTYINDLVGVADAKAFTEAEESEIKNIMQEIKGDSDEVSLSWDAAGAVRARYNYDEYYKIKDFIRETKYSKKFLSYTINKVLNLSSSTIGTLAYNSFENQSVMNVFNGIENIVLPITFGYVYLLLLFGVCYLVYRMIKYADIDWFFAMLTIFILANLFTLIVGAPFEATRLFIVSVIPTLMLIAYIISKVQENRSENKDENNLFYKLFLQKTDNSIIQFIRYIFVGGIAAVINIGGLYILKEMFEIQYLVANVIAFILGLITNYKLSKLLVFADENSMNKLMEFFTYSVIGVLGLGFDTLFMWVFTDKIHFYFMISKIISTGLVFIWNFIGRKSIYAIMKKVRKDN